MKKYLIVLLIFTLVLSACSLTLQGATPTAQPDCTNFNCGKLHWVRSESYFVQYTLNGDTVVFQYSLCFENHSNSDIELSYLGANFKEEELSNWIEYQQFYKGVCPDGSSCVQIEPGEKIDFLFSFEGKYLGGKVNDNLSLPVKIVFMSDSDMAIKDTGIDSTTNE